jgi:AcrR family transcriptional regulator
MPSGRVRQFDADEALDRAMAVFWKRGYEGTTLDELTAAMGINRPSLYAAFGNKEELYRKVLDRYRAGPVAFVAEALAQPTAREVAEALLRGTVRMLTDKTHPAGCMVVRGTLACGVEAEGIRDEVAASREQAVGEIRGRFERAVAEGDLPKGSDCTALARYVTTVMHGMAVQPMSKSELTRVVEMALKAWPG